MNTPPDVDWSTWTVILLKPDCVARNLVHEIIGQLANHVQISAVQYVTVSERQIHAHYADMLPRSTELGVDVPADLHRRYVGQIVATAIGHGPDATIRTRELLGHFDPARADPASIRGRYGTDNIATARAEHRLIDNLIHTSDNPIDAEYEFDIWYGRDQRHLLARDR